MPKKSPFEKFNWEGLQSVVTCVDVYDGDTITVETDFRLLIKKYYSDEHHALIDKLPYQPVYLKVRMMGYNSAEMRPTKGTAEEKSKEKKKAIEARDFLRDLILGKKIWCHFLAKKEGIMLPLKQQDPHGRWMSDVFTLNEKGEKDTYVNELMLKSGHGAHYDGRGEKKYEEDV